MTVGVVDRAFYLSLKSLIVSIMTTRQRTNTKNRRKASTSGYNAFPSLAATKNAPFREPNLIESLIYSICPFSIFKLLFLLFHPGIRNTIQNSLLLPSRFLYYPVLLLFFSFFLSSCFPLPKSLSLAPSLIIVSVDSLCFLQFRASKGDYHFSFCLFHHHFVLCYLLELLL